MRLVRRREPKKESCPGNPISFRCLSLSCCSYVSPFLNITRKDLTATVGTTWKAVIQIKSWWTGEDSNLRSSQGAADLQSAAINHSATCPLNANHWMSMPPRSSRPYSSSRLSRGAAESLHAGKAKNPFRYAASQPPLAGPRACLKTKSVLERETGIEPATNSLEGCDSTTELLPQTSKNFWSRRPGLNR